MSEHSIEELERQYRAATSKAQEASKAAAEARSRLDRAKLEATGLLGHMVSFTMTSWRNTDPKEVRFVVRKLARWGDEVVGPIVRKDGTLGERDGQQHPSKLTDLGLYVEPSR